MPGIGNALTQAEIPESMEMDRPSDLQQAFEIQHRIGWHQVVYAAQYKWSRKIIHMFWAYRLELWKIRDTLVHGNPGDFSKLEKHKIEHIIHQTYQHLFPQASK